jgi:hypothetical protein
LQITEKKIYSKPEEQRDEFADSKPEADMKQ